VFDLSRSIDLHQTSMQHTSEKAISGVTKGLINEGEIVVWQAKHLFKKRKLKTLISKMQPFDFFEDQMLEGDFKMMKHRHVFKFENGKTTMIDLFEFESPYGFAGKLFNGIFLKNYMRHLLQNRNAVIKEYAETEKWKMILKPSKL
jgi:hypothetical protein